ncbi:MAG: tyrosine-type recombinase/integrase [archaeon]
MQKLIKSFFEEAEILGKYSEHTIKNYKVTYNQFQKYLNSINKSWLEVEPKKDVMGFLSMLKEKNKGLSKATINAKLGALKSLYLYFEGEGYIDFDPTKGITRVAPDKKIKSRLTRREVNSLINHAHCKRDKAIIALLYASGLRISELTALNKDDIYEVSEEINVKGVEIQTYGKGRKERRIFIPQRYIKYTFDYLAERKDNLDALFISNRGKRIHPDTIRKNIDKLLEEVNIDKNVTPHTFRRSYATYLLNKGVPMSLISENLGHSGEMVTHQSYADYTDKTRSEATAKAFI